ncbi:MAG: hypothetical protein PHW03_09575 [Eubacteriales bacterium]|nr:hypothetical protein [Eubacteriales bacterium]MDD4391023.1 hypothetical protein [Eubacteriales bacterium]
MFSKLLLEDKGEKQEGRGTHERKCIHYAVGTFFVGFAGCAADEQMQEPEFEMKEVDGVTEIVETSDPLVGIIQSSKSPETKAVLMDFFGPAYGEGGMREKAFQFDPKEFSPSSYDQDLLDEVKKLSQMEGKEFEKEFDILARERTVAVAEKALNNTDITLYPEFVDNYIVKYAPQYADELQKQTDEKWKRQVPLMIEALKDAPDSIVYQENFIRDYADRYAPQYSEMLREGYKAESL